MSGCKPNLFYIVASLLMQIFFCDGCTFRVLGRKVHTELVHEIWYLTNTHSYFDIYTVIYLVRLRCFIPPLA